MTERLYYTDSFLREFDAQALECKPAGERFEVVLDRTAFYPASGGQPHDTGRLGEAEVLEVFEREDNAVVHVTDRAVARGPVRGAIDWERRFDHIQQHTGQHLISAAFLELFRFPTVSFHLGRDVSTIDLAAPSVVPRHLEEAERLANRAIFEDRPVRVSFASAAQLAEAGIRKAVERAGLLRVVEIEGFDRQPCGGTHAQRTGQVGLLLLRRLEKQKQNWRVEFVCGFRAWRVARRDYAALGEAAGAISCGLPEVPAMVAKALEERQAAQRERQRLLERLAEMEARTLAASGGGRGRACLRRRRRGLRAPGGSETRGAAGNPGAARDARRRARGFRAVGGNGGGYERVAARNAGARGREGRRVEGFCAGHGGGRGAPRRNFAFCARTARVSLFAGGAVVEGVAAVC